MLVDRELELEREILEDLFRGQQASTFRIAVLPPVDDTAVAAGILATRRPPPSWQEPVRRLEPAHVVP